MRRLGACLALLWLAGCASQPDAVIERDGCRVLPARASLTDVRMHALTLKQDAKGCRAVGRAPTQDIAAIQQRALVVMATAHCGATATPGEIQQADTQGVASYGFTLLLAAKPDAVCHAPRTGDRAMPVVSIDEASRRSNPPRYPPTMTHAGIEGRVILTLLVDPDGAAAAALVQTSSGQAAFDQSATEAARKWRFHRDAASKHEGLAVVRVPVRFAMD
ncbi:energy transducer TonB [Luteimonas fraxinea]|uniref:energy transducer TonB n=1 Tax=Luteimonas fraxinea TaxID=2901869 RepID=UPI001E4DCD44|nr:energy transducer TonB [Luteimonas fraxinea]MCD9124941.1 energy transducer TonB [Luteimonas fraxinea]